MTPLYAEPHNKPVIILGAGATKACGGPLTNEILPLIFRHQYLIEREQYLSLLREFLLENFHCDGSAEPAGRTLDEEPTQQQYPPLPLLLSLIDLGIDRKQPFRPLNTHGIRKWPHERSPGEENRDSLLEVRRALEYAIFALLDHMLKDPTGQLHERLLQKICPYPVTPAVISFNYDLIIDNSLIQRCQAIGDPAFPSYGCDIVTPHYRAKVNAQRAGTLLKLHGSLNWMFCPGCQRLEIGVSSNGKGTYKVLNQLYNEQPYSLNDRYACTGTACSECGTNVRPVMITPTYFKDYRNPHIAQVWYQAEQMLRQADRVYFIGYSLPDDDVHITYLLKRGLAHLDSNKITIVGRESPHHIDPTCLRYQLLFGPDIDWHGEGLQSWLR